jgi:YaaC-like Protein
VPRIVPTENPGDEVCRYLRHWTDLDFVGAEIDALHASTPAEKRRRKTRDLCASIGQGLELIESARASSLLTKPLPMFYATEALGKAVCILLDADLEGSNFKAHGLLGVKKQRYFVRTLACKVAAPGSDVWSRLFKLANAERVQLTEILDGTGRTYEARYDLDSKRPRTGSELVLGELLRHLPELTEDVPIAKWGHPYVVHVPNFLIRSTTGPPSHAAVTMTLRHAHHTPTKEMIVEQERPRGILNQYTQTRDVYDVLDYSATGKRAEDIPAPVMRLDLFGQLYMDFSRRRVALAEFPIYYASLFTLSDMVRYQGQWKRLLDDHPQEAVLVDRFLAIATRKVPNLVLNELSRTLYLFKQGA